MERETMTFEVATAFKRDIRIAAAMRGISASELIRKAVEKEIKKPESKGNRQPAATSAGAAFTAPMAG